MVPRGLREHPKCWKLQGSTGPEKNNIQLYAARVSQDNGGPAPVKTSDMFGVFQGP